MGPLSKRQHDDRKTNATQNLLLSFNCFLFVLCELEPCPISLCSSAISQKNVYIVVPILLRSNRVSHQLAGFNELQWPWGGLHLFHTIRYWVCRVLPSRALYCLGAMCSVHFALGDYCHDPSSVLFLNSSSRSTSYSVRGQDLISVEHRQGRVRQARLPDGHHFVPFFSPSSLYCVWGTVDTDSLAANYRPATSRASSELGVRTFTQVLTAIGSASYAGHVNSLVYRIVMQWVCSI